MKENYRINDYRLSNRTIGLSIIGQEVFFIDTNMHSEGKLAIFGSKGKPEKINLVNEKREAKPHNAIEKLRKLSQMLLQDI